MGIKYYETNTNAEKKVAKNFQCQNCSKLYSSKDYLKRHIYSVHEGHKDYECDICNKSFSQNYELKSHVQKKHPKDGEIPEIFYCDVCAKPLADKRNLDRHIKYVHQITENNYHCDLW